ncbi:hypothetical protein BVX97_01610 [bacterium E08(2017)]|nr:hypothetical protein BVX97_01610 [bacterium E08(2017)]
MSSVVSKSHATGNHHGISHAKTNSNMKPNKSDYILWWLMTSGLVSCLLIGTGCEDNLVDDNLNQPNTVGILDISPDRIELGTNNIAIFTASGGTAPYSWSVSDSSIGTVNQTEAGTVTYTRATVAVGANLVILRDKNNWEVQATVTQE